MSGGQETTAGEMAADAVLDTVGLFCPVPIIRTADRLKRMSVGEILEILSDDRVILIDLPAWCGATGHEFLGSRQSGSEIRLFVRKTPGRVAAAGRIGKGNVG